MIIHVPNKNTLIINDFKLRCCIGKGGINSNKKEGDYSTPKGLFSLRKLYFRKDRVGVPNCKINKKIIKRDLAWCDDPKHKKKPKIFIQVNLGNEVQKSGIDKRNLNDFYKFCKNLNLDIIGTMCIPPNDNNTEKYFLEMNDINKELNFKELSMGMSGDYLEAIKYNATYIRIGSKIFGNRT